MVKILPELSLMHFWSSDLLIYPESMKENLKKPIFYYRHGQCNTGINISNSLEDNFEIMYQVIRSYFIDDR